MNTGHVAGMAWVDIAASAYRAYAASTGNKNFRGELMPHFNDLPVTIKTAWEAAVRQADSLRGNTTGEIPVHCEESRWIGWIPPQHKETGHS